MSSRNFLRNSRYNDGTTWLWPDHADHFALHRAFLRIESLRVCVQGQLAASAKIARKLGLLTLTTRTAREAVLDGYQQSLKNDGCPIVLAELERDLEKLGIGALENTKELAKQEFELASFGSSPNGEDHISRLEGVPHLSRAVDAITSCTG